MLLTSVLNHCPCLYSYGSVLLCCHSNVTKTDCLQLLLLMRNGSVMWTWYAGNCGMQQVMPCKLLPSLDFTLKRYGGTVRGWSCLNCFQPIPLLQLSSTVTSLIIWPFRSSRSICIMGLFTSYTIIPGHTLQPAPAKSCLTWAGKFSFTCHIVQTWHHLTFIYSCPWAMPYTRHLPMMMSWISGLWTSLHQSLYLSTVRASWVCLKNSRGCLIAMVTTSIRQINMMMWFYITLPIFTGLGWCPIVNWDLSGAVSIFGLDALPVIHQLDKQICFWRSWFSNLFILKMAGTSWTT